MIPREPPPQVVRHNDIGKVIGQYVSCAAADTLWLCPFTTKNASFVVYQTSQSFYCFGCGAPAGDVVISCAGTSQPQLSGKRQATGLPRGMPAAGGGRPRIPRRQRCWRSRHCRYFYEQLNAKPHAQKQPWHAATGRKNADLIRRRHPAASAMRRRRISSACCTIWKRQGASRKRTGKLRPHQAQRARNSTSTTSSATAS